MFIEKQKPAFRIRIVDVKTGKSRSTTVYGGENENTKTQDMMDKLINILK